MQENTRKTLGKPQKPARPDTRKDPRSGVRSGARPDASKNARPDTRTEARPAVAVATATAAAEFQPIDIKPDSLAFCLVGAAQAVSYVLEGTALPMALSRVFTQTNALPQARGAIQDISYRTMRQVGRVDALIKVMASKTPEPALLYSLLCCSLTLLIGNEGEEHPAYEEFVVVDQAVTAATSSPHMVFAKGMVNAVLRRYLREKDDLLKLVMKQPAATWNYPQWWVDQCKTAYPQDWQAILSTGNHAPPMTLRINSRVTTVAAYLELLASKQIAASQIGPSAIKLAKPMPVQHIPGFEEGMASVQDAAAQLAAPLLDVQDGMRVLDACAAPGGKTGHLLELADIELLALDSDPARIQRIHDNLARLKLFATVKDGDASRTGWWDSKPYDRILADVPCTASGVVRRHPDSRWLRRKTDAAQLAALSARILDNLWHMLKPGGKMLMVTCSIWPLESEAQATAFVTRHGAIRLDAPGQMLPTLPTASAGNNEHDGLFYALFQKPLQN
ncbi:16S rRNA (cytosine(967)-C(5))-methyltransferase RsmB [Undibacterium sp. Ji50W]|uniref:16S rRNA (cytosine(967)-C(5))-methyltransferase RsmB n=1 Tax=Undibacterium sp. Ji50W TaxID=3413041 RepID=UPI003BEFEDAA